MKHRNSLLALVIACILVTPAFSMPTETGGLEKATGCDVGQNMGEHPMGFGLPFFMEDLTEDEMAVMTWGEFKAQRKIKMEGMAKEGQDEKPLGPQGPKDQCEPCEPCEPCKPCEPCGMEVGPLDEKGPQDMKGEFGPNMGVPPMEDGKGPFFMLDLAEDEMDKLTLKELKDKFDITMKNRDQTRDQTGRGMAGAPQQGQCGMA